MEAIRQIVNKIDKPALLDIATGTGQFLNFVANMTLDMETGMYVGVDSSSEHIEKAKQIHKDQNFDFMVMDGYDLLFEDNRFDVVMISNSLHHMERPEMVLKEMIRVLKKDGILFVYEMISDQLTQMQETHKLLHHYWAKVDRLTGIYHQETYSRSDLQSLISVSLELEKVHIEIIEDAVEDSAEMNQALINAMASYLKKSETLQDYQCLKAENELLLERIYQIGFALAPEYLLIYKKIVV